MSTGVCGSGSDAPTWQERSPRAHARHTELYHKFLEMTEAKIEAFLATKGYDPSAFYKLCRQVHAPVSASARRLFRDREGAVHG